MILNQLLLFISFLDIFILINGDEQFHFGIINHHTQWYFHCPQNNTKVLEPPSNDQPLISYECPYPSLSIEILPIEIDFTFLCHLQSRLIWIIIDLYQYNTFFWLIDSKDIEIKIELNNQIELNNSKSEVKNYTNRNIILNAFYIPFESIDILLYKQIEINIRIKNFKQLNQCQFFIKANYLWKTFIDNNCDSDQSKTFFIQYAKCDFYSNKFIASESTDTKLQVQAIDNILITTTTTTTTSIDMPDFNSILSIDEKQLTTNDSQQNPITSSVAYHHYYLSIEEKYRQILASLARSRTNTTLLKLTFLCLLIILVILVIFFLYMLCYHYYIRSRPSSLIKKSSVSI